MKPRPHTGFQSWVAGYLACCAAGTSDLAIGVTTIGPDAIDLADSLDNIERDLILAALEHADGNQAWAAQLLGLKRTTLVEKLRKRKLLA